MSSNRTPEMSIDDWARTVVAELRTRTPDLGTHNTAVAPGLVLESVELDGSLPTASIVLVFRDLTRSPRVRYGYRWSSLPSWFETDWDAPAAHARLIWANLEEATLELPDHPGSDEVVWIN